MTVKSEDMLDIVRRIATHLKEDSEPGQAIEAQKQRAAGGRAGAEAGSSRDLSGSGAGRSSKRSERGFTIPEMLITMVLVVGTTALITTAIHQIFLVAKDGNSRLAVLGDVQNAAIWIGRDVNESASWSAGSGTVYGTLTTGDPTLQYRYSYDSASTSLIREHLVSGSPVSTLNIARQIANQGDVSFSVTGNLITVSITGTNGTEIQSATLKLGMRVK